MHASRFWVDGKVQGVWYRAHTRDRARELGLTGWVRNLSDGRVEVLAEGSRSELDSLEVFLRQGSPASQVESVERAEEEPSGAFSNFEIRF